MRVKSGNLRLKRPDGVGTFKFHFLIWKRYFDQGYSITNYIKYLVAVVGVTTGDLGTTVWLAVGYTLACFLVGWVWYNYDFMWVDNEIGNQYNPFVGEVRNAIDEEKI